MEKFADFVLLCITTFDLKLIRFLLSKTFNIKKPYQNLKTYFFVRSFSGHCFNMRRRGQRRRVTSPLGSVPGPSLLSNICHKELQHTRQHPPDGNRHHGR